MHRTPVAQLVIGTVAGIDLSGSNSAEVTLLIQPENRDDVVAVFAAIIDGLEKGASSYVNMALTAMSTGRKLEVSYLVGDKPRINGMNIR